MVSKWLTIVICKYDMISIMHKYMNTLGQLKRGHLGQVQSLFYLKVVSSYGMLPIKI